MTLICHLQQPLPLPPFGRRGNQRSGPLTVTGSAAGTGLNLVAFRFKKRSLRSTR